VTVLAGSQLAARLAPAGSGPTIGRRAAQDLARRELSKAAYQESTVTRIVHWAEHILADILRAGGQVPGGWWTSVALVAALAAVIAGVTAWIRPSGLRRGRSLPVLTGPALTASGHRELAGRHAADGELAAAIVERVRAIAATVEEAGLLPPQPGRTADELGRDAGRALPALSGQLAATMLLFDEVRYGGRAGTAGAYDRVCELDRLVAAASTGAARTAKAGVS